MRHFEIFINNIIEFENFVSLVELHTQDRKKNGRILRENAFEVVQQMNSSNFVGS